MKIKNHQTLKVEKHHITKTEESYYSNQSKERRSHKVKVGETCVHIP